MIDGMVDGSGRAIIGLGGRDGGTRGQFAGERILSPKTSAKKVITSLPVPVPIQLVGSPKSMRSLANLLANWFSSFSTFVETTALVWL